jgi:hypothetical protein
VALSPLLCHYNSSLADVPTKCRLSIAASVPHRTSAPITRTVAERRRPEIDPPIGERTGDCEAVVEGRRNFSAANS